MGSRKNEKRQRPIGVIHHLRLPGIRWQKSECRIIGYCCYLSSDARSCNILRFKEITLMLDCGLSAQTVLNFLPLPLVPNARLNGLPGWVPRDVTDPQLEGELKECCGKVFIDSAPEFLPPQPNIIDFSEVVVILISNYLCMLALPFITEGTGFNGVVYATEPTLQIGSTTSEDEGCDADISEGSLLPKHHNASQNQAVEEQHPRQSLSWSGAKAITPKHASKPTSLDGSFMEHRLPTFSGSLVNTVSKLITSTPETLQLNEISEAGALSQSDDEQMAKLESDEEDLYPVDNNCKENNFVTANDIETSLEISGRNAEEDVTLIDATDISPMKHETLADPEENASDSMTFSVTASMMTERSASSAVGVENVSQRVHLMQYAKREGQGRTKKAKTILKGYAEIPSLLGLQYVRRIRGDNYCAVRSAIFQVLANGIPIPSGTEAFQYLSQALNDKKCKWIENWTFAGRLSYDENNVMHGMKVCLQYLDSVASLLSSVNGNKEDTLVALLNSQPITDLHIMEAVKLHMLYHAMQLLENDLYDLEVPFFAILMFARDTSKTPEDFMNNHLREVGDTGGLEHVEMCLLGYALGVTIRVVRPCAYGTDGFICSYPDYLVGNLPQIFLIAEEDVHYNVLVI